MATRTQWKWVPMYQYIYRTFPTWWVSLYSSAGWSNIVQSTAERGNNFRVIIFYFWSRFQMMKKKEQNIWWDENFAVWWCARRVGYLFCIYLEGGEGRKEGRGNVLWFYRTRAAAAASSHWCGWYSPCNRRTRASGLSHNIPPAPSIRSFGVRLGAAPCSDCYSSCSGN